MAVQFSDEAKIDLTAIQANMLLGLGADKVSVGWAKIGDWIQMIHPCRVEEP